MGFISMEIPEQVEQEQFPSALSSAFAARAIMEPCLAGVSRVGRVVWLGVGLLPFRSGPLLPTSPPHHIAISMGTGPRELAFVALGYSLFEQIEWLWVCVEMSSVLMR